MAKLTPPERTYLLEIAKERANLRRLIDDLTAESADEFEIEIARAQFGELGRAANMFCKAFGISSEDILRNIHPNYTPKESA